MTLVAEKGVLMRSRCIVEPMTWVCVRSHVACVHGAGACARMCALAYVRVHAGALAGAGARGCAWVRGCGCGCVQARVRMNIPDPPPSIFLKVIFLFREKRPFLWLL